MTQPVDRGRACRQVGVRAPLYCQPRSGGTACHGCAAGRVRLAHGVWVGSARLFRLSRAPPRQCLTNIERRFDSFTFIETDMSKTTPEQNKALVLEAFDTLFNKRDYAAAERFWSDRYIQHSAHIAPGREGLFALIRSAPDTLRYENQLIVAEGDYVIAHGRFSGNGRPAAWVAADVVRFEDGKLAEHWDVLQDEATQAQSVSGLPMFGDRFPG